MWPRESAQQPPLERVAQSVGRSTQIDIVIVNYFSAQDVAKCLDCLGQWIDGTVWLIDNSCNSVEAKKLSQLVGAMPWVKLVFQHDNIGFGRACNGAFGLSAAPFVLLLNPDARISSAGVLSLADELILKRWLGALSPKIYWNPEGSFLLPCAYGLTPWVDLAEAVLTRMPKLARWVAHSRMRRDRRRMAALTTVRVPFLAGAVLMVRREAVVQAGGLFDPAYFMFYEDSDLSLRLRRCGYALGVSPFVTAIHEYRHKAYKAELMQASQKNYIQKMFPISGKVVAWLRAHFLQDRIISIEKWFDQILPEVRSLMDFERLTQGAPVLAISPSPLGWPCLLRDRAENCAPLCLAEWELLEPGAYTVILGDDHATPFSTQGRGVSWVRFYHPGLT